MALQRISAFQSDATGSNETIVLEPASTQAGIASAVYGLPAQVLTIAPDRKSFSFTVQSGVHALVITLASPNSADETVQLTQGGNLLVDPTISQHSAVCTLLIQGT